MAKYKRVFQMGFDIAEGDVPSGEIESLFNALEEHINNFYDRNGNRIEFLSIGQCNVEDMSHAYGEDELKEINSDYPFNEGEDYYTIEDNQVIWSCWDDQSEELYDENPTREYFQTVREAVKFLQGIGIKNIEVSDCNNTYYKLNFL